MSKKILEQYIELALHEAKMREADVTGGVKVPHGSSEHIKDLETRIRDLSTWRDQQRKGSEARANYARLISRLRGELNSARRSAERASKK